MTFAVQPQHADHPAYDFRPQVETNIHDDRYLNRFQGGRRLEREPQRKLRLMWVTDRLALDFKSISDFRLDSGTGIGQACRQSVAVRRKLKLLVHGIVAVDRSKSNRLFAGSLRAGQRAAAVMSLLQSAGRMEELLPHRWQPGASR